MLGGRGLAQGRGGKTLSMPRAHDGADMELYNHGGSNGGSNTKARDAVEATPAPPQRMQPDESRHTPAEKVTTGIMYDDSEKVNKIKKVKNQLFINYTHTYLQSSAEGSGNPTKRQRAHQGYQ